MNYYLLEIGEDDLEILEEWLREREDSSAKHNIFDAIRNVEELDKKDVYELLESQRVGL